MSPTTNPQPSRLCLFLSDFWPYIVLGFIAGVVLMGLLGYVDAKNSFQESL